MTPTPTAIPLAGVCTGPRFSARGTSGGSVVCGEPAKAPGARRGSNAVGLLRRVVRRPGAFVPVKISSSKVVTVSSKG